MVSNNRFDNQNEYSISDITNKISTLEDKVNSGGSGNSSGDSQNSSNLSVVKQELSNKCDTVLSEAKAYTDTEKAKYLPLSGGTVSGLLTCVASNSISDVNNKALTSYIADITEANSKLSITKGDGTSSVLSIDKVQNAATADNASNLGGYPSTNYIRSINNISPDVNGNVKVTTSEVDLTGIVKSVSDKLRLSSSCLPSTTYDELTQVSGATYTAPADGWFVFSGVMGTSTCYISLGNTVTGLRHLCTAQPASAFLCVYMMARKGETVILAYTPYTSAKIGRFCYNNPTDKE